MRMPVALDHLRRNRRGFQSQARTHFLFEFGREVSECPDRAGKLADAQVLCRSLEARYIALRLRIPVRDLEAEGDRLGVDSVRAANHRTVFEFPRAAFEHVSETFEIASD